MEAKLPFLVISTTFLLLGIIIITASMIQDKAEIATFATTSNILFRYGSSHGKHPNELDTFKGIFTKDTVDKDPVTTKLDLTQDELDTIYQKMVDIDFFSYPKGYHPKPEGDTVSTQTPFTVYYIEYHNENGTKVVYWTT
jgi:hypothetical protein